MIPGTKRLEARVDGKAERCFYGGMKTTVELPDAVFRQAKAEAALEGRALRAFILDAVVHELDRTRESDRARQRVSLPLVRSRRPGSLRITGDTVADALAAEDRHVLA